ncbi:MAG: thiolase family protein [Terracidiphilus sp.]|jgi:acetyl-CoA C-acetyltransferase
MKIVIVAAKRTAIGTFMGTLKDVSAVDLGVAVAKSVVTDLPKADIADVIVGNVLQAGGGMNPARQVALKSGLPAVVPAQTINRVCASGLQAVVNAVQAIKAGEGSLYLAGGIENMTRVPFLLQEGRTGRRLGNMELLDSMLSDGLTDVFGNYHMGVTAETVATRWGISRADQDTFAVESHRRAATAIAEGHFREEIVPVEIPSRKGTVTFLQDEHVRPDTTLEGLQKLRPAFKPDGGTITPGNSSGINDGAAMVVVTTEEYAKAHGLPILAEILSHSIVGLEPDIMGVGPSTAVPAALEKAGLALADIDLVEGNEAFAATSLAVMRDLKLDHKKFNISGGGIALGHPLGASGARILVTLIHALRRTKEEFGVATLCAGGGMGIAMVVRARC